jgi:hypothetical protein
VSDRILTALGEREHTPLSASEATQVRNRAYTLAYREYEEVRRGITFLRWYERDFDTIVPSLHTTSSRRRSSGQGESEGEGETIDASRPGGAKGPVAPLNGESTGGTEDEEEDKDSPFLK